LIECTSGIEIIVLSLPLGIDGPFGMRFIFGQVLVILVCWVF